MIIVADCVLSGIDYVAASGQQPAVASMSLGGFPNKALDNAVQGLIDAGVTVVVAAGNFNMQACKSSPARVTEVRAQRIKYVLTQL